jgi:hypothetical protein
VEIKVRVQHREDGSQAVLRDISRADVVRFHRVSSSIFAAVQAGGVDVQEVASGQGVRGFVMMDLDDDFEDDEDDEQWLQDAAQQALLGCPEAVQLLAERTSASARLCAIAAEILPEATLRDLLQGPVEQLYPAAAFLKNVATNTSASGVLALQALRAHIWNMVQGSLTPSVSCPPLVLRELSAVLAAMASAVSDRGDVYSCGAWKESCSYEDHASCASTSVPDHSYMEHASFASTCVPESSELNSNFDVSQLCLTLKASGVPRKQALPADIAELGFLTSGVWEH